MRKLYNKSSTEYMYMYLHYCSFYDEDLKKLHSLLSCPEEDIKVRSLSVNTVGA